MLLTNHIDRKIQKQKLAESQEERITLSFYKYTHIENPQGFRDQLFADWSALGVFGRVYVAREGINAQISVSQEHFQALQDNLEDVECLKGIRLNLAVEEYGKSFYILKIKVKKKIVADGLNDNAFDVTEKGKHVDAEQFNQLTDDPNTIVVDMRNHYESEVGHFVHAILPDADTFRDALPIVKETLAPYRDRNIIMYCTGGIRCEKASAYFKHLGFNNIYQLEGGITKYARDVKQKGLDNKFRGKNFVFDERLGEKITEDIISACHQCGKPCDTHTNCKNDTCNLLFIQCDDCAAYYEGCCSDQCKDFTHLREEEQQRLRSLHQKERIIFNKGRADHLKDQRFIEFATSSKSS